MENFFSASKDFERLKLREEISGLKTEQYWYYQLQNLDELQSIVDI